jgi:hypothetical protein
MGRRNANVENVEWCTAQYYVSAGKGQELGRQQATDAYSSRNGEGATCRIAMRYATTSYVPCEV